MKIMKQERRNLINGLLFISPWIIGFLLFTVYPVLNSLYYSLCDYNIVQEPEFIGFKNYIDLFTNDKLFYTTLRNTFYMVFVGLTITIIVTLIISVILNVKRLKGLSFFRVVFFIPTLVPLVILAILWQWVLQPDSGVLNTLLRYIGIEGPGWFASPTWSKPAFILMAIWGAGNIIIIFLAGLQDIPDSLYEAVSIDGGSFMHQFYYVTLPMLRPVILYNVITGIIRVFQSFAESFIITQGGPDNSTMFYSLYLYQNAFQYVKMGYASAMAWILLIIALAFTIALFRFTGWGQTEQ